jgi:transmembrane sensor
MQMNDDNEQAHITGEAADWFVNRADGPAPDEEQHRRFTQWLDSSPRHAEEYLEMAQLARDLSLTTTAGLSVDALVERARATQDDAGDSRVLQFARHSSSDEQPLQQRHRWLPAAAAAAIGVVALGLLWWSAGRNAGTEVNELRFASGHGELLTQPLEDGSVLQLNTDTSVVVRYSSAERRVDVERGQAMFQVVHDTSRPFRVMAGVAQVVDIGTRFDVYLLSDATRVTVVEGSVEVSRRGAEGKLLLVAGQRVQVTARDLPGTAELVDVGRETAYLRRQIVFERQPLAAVADEFNRYVPVPIQITTPQLRRMTITGSFTVDDVESFIAYLRRLEGVNVEVTSTRILVSKS